jgi:phospholipid/cholesterol/gamma-HCH transport system substrate-binding protein
MITRRTKVQLTIFLIITLVGVSFVGARYARLGRLVVPDSYQVTAHFKDSGGIFSGAMVSYRGKRIGQVKELVLTEQGVDVVLDVQKSNKTIPADTLAVVGNRSAVGEQYVDLQPKTDDKPFLEAGSQIPVENTSIPLSTDTLLTNLSNTVDSVDQDALRTTVDELGQAFDGTGEDLQRIIDTGNSFINLANDNFDTTAALIRDSNTVLNGQIASDSALRTFASQLSLFTDTLSDSDPDLRKLIDNGSPAVNALRTFIEDNKIDLGELINNLVTTGEVVVENLNGVKAVLSIYPYVVEGGFTVVSKSPSTGLYDAHFGMVLSTSTPCHQGYEGTDTRPPSEGSNKPMNEDARCTEPPTKSNPRGAQNLPSANRVATSYAGPSVASFDPDTGKLTWGTEAAAKLESTSSLAPRTLGKESWKWLFLQPLTTTGRE